MAGNAIRDLVISVRVDADTKGLKDVENAQDSAKKGSVALGTAVGNLAASFVKMGLAAAKAGAAMVTDLVFGTIKAADELAKTSKQLDVSAQGLQRLGGAAQLSGADMNDLNRGVRTLTTGLANAKIKGSGPAVDAIETLGLTVEDVEAALADGDIEGTIGLIGDAFNETGDSAEKNAALLQLFGAKAGSQLRPLLEQGSEGITELGDKIKNVIPDEALEQFEALADEQFLLEDQVTSLKNEIATALGPAVSDVIGQISEWISENEDFIKQDLPAILANVGSGLVDLVGFIIETVESWREFKREIVFIIETFETKFPDALGKGGEVLEGIGNVAEFVGDKIRAVVNFILDALAKIEVLSDKVNEIRTGLGGNQDTPGKRRGNDFLGGGTDLVDQRELSPDTSSDRLQQIADGNFSEADRNAAESLIPLAVQREALLAADEAIAANEIKRKDNAVAAERAQRRQAAGKRRASEKRKREGGGKKGKAKKDEPTLTELVASATGAPVGVTKVLAGGNTLSGTILNNIDQSDRRSFSLEIDIEAPGAGPDQVASIVDGVEETVREVLRQSNRTSFDFWTARREVGPG